MAIKKRKHGPWLIAENTETREKSFGLLQSEVTTITDFQSAETMDAEQNLEEVPGLKLPESQSGYKNGCHRSPDN